MQELYVETAKKPAAGHTKLGLISKCFVCGANELDMMITGRDASREQVLAFEKVESEVRYV